MKENDEVQKIDEVQKPDELHATEVVQETDEVKGTDKVKTIYEENDRKWEIIRKSGCFCESEIGLRTFIHTPHPTSYPPGDRVFTKKCIE